MNEFWQYLLPQHWLSRLTGFLAQCRWPWLKNQLIRLFIARYAVDMSQAEIQDPLNYATFNEFFTRSLSPGVRPIVADKNIITSPVDGYLSQYGRILQGRIFQAKGFDFSAEELLGSPEQAAFFADGCFATLYLAPANYHRVHMPIDGKLTDMTYIPGRLFSVNQNSTRQIPRLFARNERVIAFFNTEFGKMAVVLVGAMIVAAIETAWAGLVTPRKNRQIFSQSYEDTPIFIAKGEEMGKFQLGSTAIILFANREVQWQETMLPDQTMIMGQAMGLFPAVDTRISPP